MKRLTLPTRIPSKSEIRRRIARTPLGEFFVWHDEITSNDLRGLRNCINRAKDERPIQAYLQRKPALLARHLGGGHGRWVIPQKRFGSEFVCDFLIADRNSFGFDWFPVELESPRKKMFNKSGDATSILHHAIHQIQNWREWLSKNLDYAQRSRDSQGLGLEDIRSDVWGYIIIGRRGDAPKKTNDLRRRMMYENRIEIRTYDWLIDAASGTKRWESTLLAEIERDESKYGKGRLVPPLARRK